MKTFIKKIFFIKDKFYDISIIAKKFIVPIFLLKYI